MKKAISVIFFLFLFKTRFVKYDPFKYFQVERKIISAPKPFNTQKKKFMIYINEEKEAYYV